MLYLVRDFRQPCSSASGARSLVPGYSSMKSTIQCLGPCLVCDMGTLNYGVDGFDDDHMQRYKVYDDDIDDDEANYIYRLRVWMLCDVGTPVHP